MLADKILPVPDDLAGVARRLHGQDIGGVTGRGDVLGINLVRNLPVLCHKAPRRTRPHVGVLIRQLLIGGRPQAEGLPGPLDALLAHAAPPTPSRWATSWKSRRRSVIPSTMACRTARQSEHGHGPAHTADSLLGISAASLVKEANRTATALATKQKAPVLCVSAGQGPFSSRWAILGSNQFDRLLTILGLTCGLAL